MQSFSTNCDCGLKYPYTYFSVESLEFAVSSEHKMFPPVKQDFDSEKLRTKDKRRRRIHLIYSQSVIQ